VLSHIISDILEVKNEDSALTKDLKRVMKSDLESRYTADAKKVMDLTSFVDPQVKGSFSDDLDTTATCCIEEALKLAEMTTLSEGAAQTEESSTTPTHHPPRLLKNNLEDLHMPVQKRYQVEKCLLLILYSCAFSIQKQITKVVILQFALSV